MELRLKLNELSNVPFSKHLILELLKDFKSPKDKISELIKKGEIFSLRRGLYAVNPIYSANALHPFLIANHLRGPSYVSLESALNYWGFIPERVVETSSVTTKLSKTYKNHFGRFSYQKLPTPYFSYGIKSLEIDNKQTVLIASPEKAICDKVVLTSGVNLRSRKQVKAFLLQDLRVDVEMLQTLNTDLISTWLENAPKNASLEMLIKTLREL
ncbi:hypothetical protein CW751_00895 [Brumimicrobium salinarum]|uniref:Death domain-containing protein n=1 Tax=Brumimicrobium salinarum TaxID=2058658 RepID=A0A2I0R5R6_9FLAO|nr:hypothetical protein [Brumimicrobium salinarum]PKR81924.1 hypothetical protein CW751_00895 [Brumimicrobium salinarum]